MSYYQVNARLCRWIVTKFVLLRSMSLESVVCTMPVTHNTVASNYEPLSEPAFCKWVLSCSLIPNFLLHPQQEVTETQVPLLVQLLADEQLLNCLVHHSKVVSGFVFSSSWWQLTKVMSIIGQYSLSCPHVWGFDPTAIDGTSVYWGFKHLLVWTFLPLAFIFTAVFSTYF